jgi:hypothetical protein
VLQGANGRRWHLQMRMLRGADWQHYLNKGDI